MRLIGIVLIFLIMASCAHKVEKENLYGQYVFSHWEKDTLVLKSDGTYYFQRFKSGQKLQNQGNWTLDSSGNEVTFKDFTFLTDGSPKGNWYSKLRTKEHEIHLMYASEENIYFKKIEY